MRARIRLASAVVLSLALTGAGCSSGSSGGPHKNTQRFVKDSGFSSDPLNYTAVSRTLLTQQNYFVSYSQTSGRLGIIDADQFTEIWGTYIDKSVPFVFNLPGYEGAGFIDEGSFTVVIREGTRRFEAPGVSVWNRARSVIAVAGYDVSARTVHIVRYRGDNNWEEVALQAFAPDDVANAARVVVSDQGRFVLIVSPASGSYAVMEDLNGAYTVRRKCVFSAEKTLSGAVIDEQSEQAYVAAGNQILKIDIRNGSDCSEPAAWPEVLLGEQPFSDIGFLDPGRIYATEGNRIHVLTRSDDSMTPSPSFPVCIEPTGVNAFGAGGYAVTCVNRTTSSDPEYEAGYIRNVNLNFYASGGEGIRSSVVEFDRKAGVVFFPDKSEFFEVFDSAAGEVTVTDVTAGSTRKVGGIYLEGVLNRL